MTGAKRTRRAGGEGDVGGLRLALAALGGIAWGFPLADPVAALVVATIIAVNAAGMLVENARLLLGRSPGPESLAGLRRTALAVPGVLAVNDVHAGTRSAYCFVQAEPARADQ